MSEAQALAYVLQRGKTTPPELARHFREDLASAHQALLRLERKRLVRRNKLSYNVEFSLTDKARNLNRQAKEKDDFLSFILFLGLATLLLLASQTKEERTDETSRD